MGLVAQKTRQNQLDQGVRYGKEHCAELSLLSSSPGSHCHISKTLPQVETGVHDS